MPAVNAARLRRPGDCKMRRRRLACALQRLRECSPGTGPSWGLLRSWARPHSWAPHSFLYPRSYYHPSPPQKVVVRSERTFDGISLDKPGSDATRTGARLPACLPACAHSALNQAACRALWAKRQAARRPPRAINHSTLHSALTSLCSRCSDLYPLCAVHPVLLGRVRGARQGPASWHADRRAAAGTQPAHPGDRGHRAGDGE